MRAVTEKLYSSICDERMAHHVRTWITLAVWRRFAACGHRFPLGRHLVKPYQYRWLERRTFIVSVPFPFTIAKIDAMTYFAAWTKEQQMIVCSKPQFF